MSSNAFEAAAKGDIEGLKACLPDTSPEDLNGVLVTAAERGDLDVVRTLTQYGVFDDWAVVSASSFGRTEVVRYLCRHGKGNLKAALIGAAAHGCFETVRILTACGVKETDEALADAAMRGYLDIVKHLTECGADMTAKVYNGESAVSLAWKRRHAEVCAYFDKIRREGVNS